MLAASLMSVCCSRLDYSPSDEEASKLAIQQADSLINHKTLTRSEFANAALVLANQQPSTGELFEFILSALDQLGYDAGTEIVRTQLS